MGLSWQLGIFVAIASGSVLQCQVVCSDHCLSSFQCYLVLLYPLTEEVFKKYGFIRSVTCILRQHV